MSRLLALRLPVSRGWFPVVCQLVPGLPVKPQPVFSVLVVWALLEGSTGTEIVQNPCCVVPGQRSEILVEELLEELLNRNFAGPPKPRAEAAAKDQVSPLQGPDRGDLVVGLGLL